MRSEIPEGETLSREYLANERTMLSWVRTGIHATGAGILLYVVSGVAGASSFAVFGILLAAFGGALEVIALARFLQFKSAIARGAFTSSALVYLLVVLGAFLLGVGYIGYVIMG